jgi:hypothetical protein
MRIRDISIIKDNGGNNIVQRALGEAGFIMTQLFQSTVNLSHRIQVKGDEMDAIPSNQER